MQVPEIRLDIQSSEELSGYAIIATFREMAGSHEVTATDVESKVHLGDVVGNTVVVAFDIVVQKFIWILFVRLVFCPAREHFLGAEIYSRQYVHRAWGKWDSWSSQAKFGSSNCTFLTPASYKMSNSFLTAILISQK